MRELKKIGPGLSEIMICGRSVDVFFDDIERFHGFISPGIVLGGFMVDWAQELLGPDVEADAIVETGHCLPDTIQILTPCTIGNGWLKVLDWDKFALTLYDKRKLNGYRVWLDLKKTLLFPKIYDWFMRRISKKDLPTDVLVEEILNAQRNVLSCRAVQITRPYGRKHKKDISVCSGCGEPYSTSQGGQCTTCQGEGYYSF
ncbi:MAG: formylmethanofuran dehydrogenase subunit E family protein [Desulfobacteraceae bacterium]|nr:MAG: formylmethanofuran dehydrogenase subunit E family protein [Desulfobacteraceae bacterium]